MICKTCGVEITGARQKRFCAKCRAARYRVTTRYLDPGEDIPEGKPGRYPHDAGYIRLRWRVAPYTYVETYEHRVFEGRVTTEDEVHHANRIRSDNRETNLHPVSTAAHHREHAPDWLDEGIRLYTDRLLSCAQVGEMVNRDASAVYRTLRNAGVIFRPSGQRNR